MRKILNHFQKHDSILYKHFVLQKNKISMIKKEKPQNYFNRLCREIICQQLSNQSGDAIVRRFLRLFPGLRVKPEDVLSIGHDALRNSGMSHAKAEYLKNLAEHVVNGDLPVNRLDDLTDHEVISHLTKVKGIGPWTAEMFLMFTLGREDVFSYGDKGLKNALKKLYGIDPSSKKQVDKIISPWSPYKTYACRVLWASLE